MADTLKVKILADNFGRYGTRAGDTIDLPEAKARSLIQQGRAIIAGRSETPDESWTVKDLEAYASERGIRLDGASRKGDMLAAIAATNEARTAGQQVGAPIDTSAEQS